MSDIYLTLKEFSEMFLDVDKDLDGALKSTPMKWMQKVAPVSRDKKYDAEMIDLLREDRKDVEDNLHDKIRKRKGDKGKSSYSISKEQWAATMAVGTLKCQRIYPGSSFQTFGEAWSAMEKGNTAIDPEQSKLVSNAMLMSIESEGKKTPLGVGLLAQLAVKLAWSKEAQDRTMAGNVAALIGRLYPTPDAASIGSEVLTIWSDPGVP